MTLKEEGNTLLLAKDLSGQVRGGQSKKYVQKEQPVVMTNIRRTHTLSCSLWGATSSQWESTESWPSERLMEARVAAISLLVGELAS